MDFDKLHETVCIFEGEPSIADFDHSQTRQPAKKRDRFPAGLDDVDLSPQEGITEDGLAPPIADVAKA